MQYEASKARNDANTAIICLPTKEHTKFSPSKTNGRRPKQHLVRFLEPPYDVEPVEAVVA
jgi:hypothetical protein